MNSQQARVYYEMMAEWHIGMAEAQVAQLWRGKTLSMSSAHEMIKQRPALEQVRRLRRRIDQWRAQLDECRNKRIQTTQQWRAKRRPESNSQEIADD